MPLAPASSHAAGAVTADSGGWVDDGGEVWTRTGATTFTVPTDLTSQYTVGTRIRATQTTTKYFTVVSSSHAGGTTTVTVTGGSDYTLAAAAITGQAHSYAENPQGWPGWFNYAPAATGYSSKTLDLARFAVIGRTCIVVCVLSGTSNATTLTLAAPIACSATAPALTSGPASGADNTVALTTPARLSILAGGATITAFKDFATAAWTGSGTKNCNGYIAYEI